LTHGSAHAIVASDRGTANPVALRSAEDAE